MFDWSSLIGDLSGFSDMGPGGIQAGVGGGAMPSPATFGDRFNAARPQGVSPMTSPISPEALASSAAARGIPPPPVDMAPIRLDPEATERWRNGVDATSDVGAALTGKTVGQPMDITSQAQKADTGVTDMSAQAKPEEQGSMDKLVAGLKGVKAPPGPELQRLSTPASPRATTAIKGGDLIALLQSLNASPGASSYQLPSTLGAAIRK